MVEQDWIKLIESRAALLAPHLRSMTLPTIGEIDTIRDYFHEHQIGRDKPLLDPDSDSRFSLETRLVWNKKAPLTGLGYSYEFVRPAEGGKATGEWQFFWGLTRNCEWIGFKVWIGRRDKPYKYPGRFEEVAEAKTLWVKEMPLPEVIAFSRREPKEICQRLGEVAREWLQAREQLVVDARNLARVFEAEDRLIQAVNA